MPNFNEIKLFHSFPSYFVASGKFLFIREFILSKASSLDKRPDFKSSPIDFLDPMK